MQNAAINNFIKIVRAGLDNSFNVLLDELNIDDIYNLARSHQVSGIVYSGAINLGIDSNLTSMQKLYVAAVSELTMHERQMSVLSTISKRFDEESIDYMPLKGSVVKQYYPKPEMRIMGDIDILVKVEDFARIKSIMESLGAAEKYESDHEYVWCTSSNVIVEFHKMLVPTYNEIYCDFFKSGWDKAIKNNNSSRHAMSKENEFVYTFTHFAKHYRAGGIGVRQLCDIWLMLSTLSLDNNYLKDSFIKLGLFEFYENVLRTLEVWFCEAEPDKITDMISNTIILGGSFGTHKSKTNALVVRSAEGKKNVKKARLLMFKVKVFPPVKFIAFKYTFLKSKPWLLPVAWVMRWFDVVFNRRKSIGNTLKNIREVNADDVIKYENEIRMVGLNFDTKEKK